MKTAISLPDPIFEAAEALARQLGMSRSGLYAAAVAEYVGAREGSRVTSALDSVYVNEPSAIDEVWLQAQARALGEEDW